MATKSGINGKVVIGSADVGQLKDWKLSMSKNMIDISAFGNTWKQQTPSLGEWSATSSGHWIVDTDTNGQTALQTAFINGTSVTLKLYIDGTHYYSGTAFISKMDVEDIIDNVATVSFEFAGSGTISYT